jgi:TPR repeat protein
VDTATPSPGPGPSAVDTATPSPGPGPSAVDTATLVTRGDALVGVRDIASARLFYERAAEMGDGPAALRMGATFDSAFLERAGIRGTKGDQQEALSWYQRARDLGDTEADRLLKTIKPH